MLSTNDTKEFLLNSTMLKDAQILLVDNDRDTRDLYTLLIEAKGARVTASRSIQDALDFLDESIPNLLVCEMRFLGESVLPLIQRVKALACSSGRSIPILVMSTVESIYLAQQLTEEVAAYLLKPIDLDDFVDQVLNLARISNTVYPPSLQTWVFNQNPVKLLCCAAGVN